MDPSTSGSSIASSSASTIRSSLIGMGFAPSLVDTVIRDNTDADFDRLLDALIHLSAIKSSNSDASSSDSLDAFLNEEDDAITPTPQVITPHLSPKPEPGMDSRQRKSESLLMMNFSPVEIHLAITTLGDTASIDDLLDFITAAQIAEKLDQPSMNVCNESLFGTMNNSLILLNMGFTEHQVSLAVETLGLHVPVEELADCIVNSKFKSSTPAISKSDHSIEDEDLQKKFTHHKGKRPKLEEIDYSGGYSMHREIEDEKPLLLPSLKTENGSTGGLTSLPYFIYCNVTNISQSSWQKMSQFLPSVQPEFVETRFFSALSRKEGYLHNIPLDNRFHVLPRSPLTLEEAIPESRRWWPAWDSRTKLECINTTGDVSQLCSHLGGMLTNTGGMPSPDQQHDIQQQCCKKNLVWVGQHRLAPIEPHHLEPIMGYRVGHTREDGVSVEERLHALQQALQTDTLGYHLSPLKHILSAEGVAVLSLFAGVGGGEVALHRLGVRLTLVVSVEACGWKRRAMRRWWEETRQMGELVQMDDVQKLAGGSLERMMKRVGGFHIVICQNPSTSAGMMPGVHGDSPAGFDFSLFCEFVRVLQAVRSGMRRGR